MSLRDRPRLSDRLRGKSGDELINEIKKEFDDSKKAWFNSGRGSPQFGSLRWEGFPFDEDVFSQRNDAGIKSHLEDLAKKHPELAGDLRCPPWGGSVDRNWEKAYTVPIAVEKVGVSGGDAGAASASSLHKHPTPSSSSSSSDNRSQPETAADTLGQHGLRNTVDIAEHIQKANQPKFENEPKRSSSAPPDSSPTVSSKKEPRRFTSKIEITPVNPFEPVASNMSNESAAAAAADVGANITTNPSSAGDDQRASSAGINRQIPITTDLPSSSQNHVEPAPPMRQPAGNGASSAGAASAQTRDYPSPQTGRKQPQVHHIPIYIEGRDDPVVPKSVETPAEPRSCTPDQAAPLKRKLNGGGVAADSTASSKNSATPKPNQVPSNERKVPVETPVSAAETQSAASHSARVCSPSPSPPPPPPPPIRKPDPLQRVQEVQQEVNDLTTHVQQYSGSSRNDKEYMYLDEMLTRNLIKLDTIEVEGDERLRVARKDVIRSIQKSIALLESKVPVAQNDVEEPNGESLANDAANNAPPSAVSSAVMDVDVSGSTARNNQNAENID